MKKETIYPPIQMLKDYSEQGDLTWEQLEEIRAVLQSRINRSGRPYITLLETLFAMNCVHEIPANQRKEAARIANGICALAAWRVSKQVYHFEKEMELLLYQQIEDIKLPAGVLKNMPYPCIYVESPNLQENDFHGFFVYYDEDHEHMESLKFMLICPNGREVQMHGIELADGKSISECLAALLKKCYQTENVEGKVQERIQIIEKMLQLVLYICAVNADIQPASEGTKTVSRKMKQVRDQYGEINKWDVGVRVVKELQQSRKKQSGDISNNQEKREKEEAHKAFRRRPVPHVRRGHWHTYWTGRKDGSEARHLILKWIPFTYINVEKVDELPAIIHEIGQHETGQHNI